MDPFENSGLPQTAIFGEEQHYYQSTKGLDFSQYAGQAVTAGLRSFQEDGTDYGNVGNQSMSSVGPMQRFLHEVDPPPLSHNVLDTRLERFVQLQSQTSNISTDTTSADSKRTRISQNELWSPHSIQAAPSRGAIKFSEATTSYPDICSVGSLPDSGIYMRELDLIEETEFAVERHDYISSHLQLNSEHEPGCLKTEAVAENCNSSSDTINVSSVIRDADLLQPIIQSDDDSDYFPQKGSKRRRSTSSRDSGPRRKRNDSGYLSGKNSRESRIPCRYSTSNRLRNRGSRGYNASSKAVKASNGFDSRDPNVRRFPCPLAGYGCHFEFASKNEWKRHVQVQHIKLGFWRCDLCPTQVDPNDERTVYHNDFNRKDLFTQHLRRMHAAPLGGGGRRGQQYPVTEENLMNHQNRCYQVLRTTPTQSLCLFCGRVFTGPNSWDERMEHVGRHLEKDRNKISLHSADWNNDKELEKYLIEEGLIEQDRSGEFKIGNGKPRRLSPLDNDDDSEDDSLISRPTLPPPRLPTQSINAPEEICSKQKNDSPPLSENPPLSVSVVPPANTTPKELPSLLSMQQDHSTQGKAHNQPRIDEDIIHNSTAADRKDNSMSSHSLLTWLDDTSDGASLENVDLPLHKEGNITNPDNFHFDMYSQRASVSSSETWGELSSSDGSDTSMHPHIYQHFPRAVKDLYTHFKEWQTNTGYKTRGSGRETNQGGASLPTNTTPSCSQTNGGKANKSPGKRRLSDEDESRASKNPKLDLHNDSNDTRLLACPFAKKNPLQHRKCFKYVLQEIARLKQHLLRVHQVPIHCVRCSKTFDTVEARDHHSRQPECIVQPPRIFEGINEIQRRQLGKRISSKKSREENWYLIYEILFPDAARPESPYIEDLCLSEELLAIREFATQAAPAWITQFANSQLPSNLRSNQQQIELFTQAAVRGVLNMILENWDSCPPGQSSVENTSHRSTPGSNHDSGYSTTGLSSGNGHSSRVTTSCYDDATMLRPTLESRTSIQPLDQIAGEPDQWGLEDFFGDFENISNDNFF